MLLLSSAGGALGWCVYLLCGGIKNDIIQSFFAIIVVAVYSEIMARLYKAPATVYLVVGLIPLVPGGGIYYTMEYCINGDMMNFMNTGSIPLNCGCAVNWHPARFRRCTPA